MPLFKKNRKKQQAKQDALQASQAQQQQQQHRPQHDDDEGRSPPKPFKYAPQLSKTSFNVGGLPVNVFGLAELTPASSRALAPDPPDICVAIHMHGRGGSADNEEKIVRQIWDRVARSLSQYGGDVRADQQQQRFAADGGEAEPRREFLIVNFDARNHGHRLTHELGQKGWKQGNKEHAFDLYSMVVGTAQDVSFLADFLPAYLFPHDERKIKSWAVTGKSLGGHAAWHVLANDLRFVVGVPLISCPSYAKLMAQRAPKSFVTNGPPYVPASLTQLIASADPAARAYDLPDPAINPFWGKKICMCSGQEDRLVPWSCAQEFVGRLCVGPPQSRQASFRVVLLEGVGHEVTETMIEEAGHWIFLHGVLT